MLRDTTILIRWVNLGRHINAFFDITAVGKCNTCITVGTAFALIKAVQLRSSEPAVVWIVVVRRIDRGTVLFTLEDVEAIVDQQRVLHSPFVPDVT